MCCIRARFEHLNSVGSNVNVSHDHGEGNDFKHYSIDIELIGNIFDIIREKTNGESLPLLHTINPLLPHAFSRVRDAPYFEEGIHRNSNLVAKEILENMLHLEEVCCIY